MKRISKITNQKKIVFYFILAIVLPSIMMGGLALRGIRNDQALVERENSRQAKESGDGIVKFTNAVLVRTEQRLGQQLPVKWADLGTSMHGKIHTETSHCKRCIIRQASKSWQVETSRTKRNNQRP